MRITIIGHNTVLIETNGLRILTDPYFGSTGNAVYMRLQPPVKTREDLLDIDLALVSHNHWDHIDSQFFHMLPATSAHLRPLADCLGDKAVRRKKCDRYENLAV